MIVMIRHNKLRATTVPNSAPDCHELGSGGGLPSAWEGCTKTLENPRFIETLLFPDFAGLVAANALAKLRASVEGIHDIGAATLRSGGVRSLVDVTLGFM